MKMYIVWASNGESYEDNNQDIWGVCSSEETASLCIREAPKQILCDEERMKELMELMNTRELTEAESKEVKQISLRGYCVPWCGRNNGVPYVSIREYDVMDRVFSKD